MLEKNEGPGGRARVFRAQGFTFDMGPSWYWMPDVFEKYFARFGKKVADYYELHAARPVVPGDFQGPGSGGYSGQDERAAGAVRALRARQRRPPRRVSEAGRLQVRGGHQPAGVRAQPLACWSLPTPGCWSTWCGMDVLQSMHKHVRRFFKDPRLLELVEFPILFLGATSREYARPVLADELRRPGAGHLVPERRHAQNCGRHGAPGRGAGRGNRVQRRK